MQSQIFAVYDKKAGTFCNPFFMPKTEMAVRAFHQAVNDPNTEINKYPADYTLHLLGTFNSDSGLIESNTVELVTALELVISE